jgi:MATE family multidrug resistance protein
MPLADTPPGTAAGPEGADPSTYGAILKLAFPLVLSMLGHTMMMMLDGLFLSWHSHKDIAALGFSSMAVWAVMSLFLGPAGYTSTFVAHYFGAKRPGRIGPAVWQGLYFALAAGAVLLALSFATETVFSFNGHPREIQMLEAIYFRINCAAGVFALLSSAASGYFTGLGRTRTLMAVHLAGFAINAVLDYALVFGRFGFASYGIAGAAIATVVAQATVAGTLILLILFGADARLHGVEVRKPEKDLFWRLMRFGFPSGMRFFIEAMGWTAFVMFVGRLGETELAATSIAFRINVLAFFPMIGMSMAVSVLVGQAQGGKRPDQAVRSTWRSLVMAEAWMLCAAASFVLFPRHLMGAFHDPEGVSPDRFNEIAEAGVILLRFVAVYSLVDAGNVIVLGALQGAGDTRWTMSATVVLYAFFGAALVLMDRYDCGLYAEWAAATIFVMAMAAAWVVRFRSGRWRSMRVIEEALV